jgi:hypothetical protein
MVSLVCHLAERDINSFSEADLSAEKRCSGFFCHIFLLHVLFFSWHPFFLYSGSVVTKLSSFSDWIVCTRGRPDLAAGGVQSLCKYFGADPGGSEAYKHYGYL